MTGYNTTEMRKINKRNVLRFIIKNEGATKPEIASALKLSMPTVGQFAEELIEGGYLQTVGMKASNGGRRAVAIDLVKGARYAVGVDITTQHMFFIILNLAGDVVASERIRRRFEDKPEFYNFFSEYTTDMLRRFNIPEERVIGTGISVQGIVSPDQKYFASHMVEGQRITPLHNFESSRPVFFLNDGTASCLAECYSHNTPNDFVYIMLSRTVGGAIVHNGKIWEGVNLHAGEFGHMVLHPDKKERCYCGHHGHMWCYTSVNALEEFAGGTYHQFFEHLAAGEAQYEKRFQLFLDDLALAINNLRAAYDSTIIIGGYLSAYMNPYMQHLKIRVSELDHLYAESKTDILLGNYSLDAAAVGAAKYYIEKFINELQ